MQVHEKSILIPLLPVTMLAPELPLARWLPLLAVLSMAPLLLRDGLAVPCVALLLIWLSVVGPASIGALGGGSGSGAQHQKQVGRKGSSSSGGGGAGRRHSRSMLSRVSYRLGSVVLWLHSCIPATAAVSAAAVCAFAALTQPPVRYPFIHDAAFTCASFVFFVAAVCELAVHTYML